MDYEDLENPIITAEDSRLRDEYTQVVKSPSSGYRTYLKVSRGDILKMKQNKYKAKKTNGYDSKKESNRARDLKNLESAGAISNLMEQVPFEVVPKQDGERSVKYIADFTYTENGEYIVEDVKSDYTRKLQLYVVKRKLMKWVHGITIRET